jgi:hypothetical protein
LRPSRYASYAIASMACEGVALAFVSVISESGTEAVLKNVSGQRRWSLAFAEGVHLGTRLLEELLV